MVDNQIIQRYTTNTSLHYTDDDVIAIDDEAQRNNIEYLANTQPQRHSSHLNNLPLLISDLIQEDYKHHLNKTTVNDQSQMSDIIEINKEIDTSNYDIELCSLCRASFNNKNPKMLTCLHTYCSPCLPKILKKINKSKSKYLK